MKACVMHGLWQLKCSEYHATLDEPDPCLFSSVLWVILGDKKFEIYSDSQKHESSCLLNNRFWCISPEPFELQIFFHHYLPHFLKSFQIEKEFFKSEHKFTWFCGKRWFFKEKVSYWKKSAILKNSENIFQGSKAQELNLHTNQFLAQKTSSNLFKSS